MVELAISIVSFVICAVAAVLCLALVGFLLSTVIPAIIAAVVVSPYALFVAIKIYVSEFLQGGRKLRINWLKVFGLLGMVSGLSIYYVGGTYAEYIYHTYAIKSGYLLLVAYPMIIVGYVMVFGTGSNSNKTQNS